MEAIRTIFILNLIKVLGKMRVKGSRLHEDPDPNEVSDALTTHPDNLMSVAASGTPFSEDLGVFPIAYSGGAGSG